MERAENYRLLWIEAWIEVEDVETAWADISVLQKWWRGEQAIRRQRVLLWTAGRMCPSRASHTRLKIVVYFPINAFWGQDSNSKLPKYQSLEQPAGSDHGAPLGCVHPPGGCCLPCLGSVLSPPYPCSFMIVQGTSQLCCLFCLFQDDKRSHLSSVALEIKVQHEWWRGHKDWHRSTMLVPVAQCLNYSGFV
jgi:hypothetical protein